MMNDDFAELPQEFTAGDALTWRVTLADYPPSVWTLNYAFRSLGGGGLNVTATADGGSFAATLTATQTAALPAGELFWQARVTDSLGTPRTLASGHCVVKPDLAALATGTAYDGRSHAKRLLDAIEACLAGIANANQKAYTIAGRSLERYELGDLLRLREVYARQYAEELRAEKLRQGAGLFRPIQVRFEPPC